MLISDKKINNVILFSKMHQCRPKRIAVQKNSIPFISLKNELAWVMARTKSHT